MKAFLGIFLFFFCIHLQAQEIITPLQFNPLVKEKSAAYHTAKTNITLTLPFVDDFSNYTVFPNPNLWSDRYAFINSTYGINPPTKGFATLDAINDSGSVYSTASTFPFIADYLTSQTIRLDTIYSPSVAPLLVKDSVYLSFFFSPSGGMGAAWNSIGDVPEVDDSLVLEFYSAQDTVWHHVWATNGMSQQTLFDSCNCYFKRVMIPIVDSALYFNNGFKFRFYNYASLENSTIPSWAGNCDEWNIDYVYLNAHRSINDTILKDIAFVEQAPSVLKNYHEMPWNQFEGFQASELKDTLFIKEVNLDNTTQLVNYHYYVRDASSTLIHTWDGGSENILPYYPNGFQTYGNHATPLVNFTFPTNSADSASFTITHIIRKDNSQNDFRPQNDTNIFTQHFYNYYAYDDGTAENGYGLNPANAQLAYRFVLNQTDTLRAVQMYFNQTLGNISQQQFYLTVWDNNGGVPGNILYQKLIPRPVYDYELNKFHTYPLDNPLTISGTFYVGWKQVTTDNLNLGFDRNTSSENKIFYNTSGTWTNSFMRGSLMIRPVLGKYISFDAISENTSNPIDVTIYPNPLTNDILHITVAENTNINDLNFKLYNSQQSLIMNQAFSSTVSVGNLPSGIYFINITNNKTNQGSMKKLVILR
ncbi:MAG: T9SS type A sorting domain-containing protein [Bacteroidota bacterium]